MPCCNNKSDKACQKSVVKRKIKLQVPSLSSVTKTSSESSAAVSKDSTDEDDAPSVPNCYCTASVQTEEMQEKIALANSNPVEKQDQGCDPCEPPAPCATDDSAVGPCGENTEMMLKALMIEKALDFLSCNVIQGLNELDKTELDEMMEKAKTGVCQKECPQVVPPLKLDRSPVLNKLSESLDFVEQQELKSVLFLKDLQRERWSAVIEAKAPDATGCCLTIHDE